MAGGDERLSDRALIVTRGGYVVNLDGLPLLHHPSRDPLALRNGRHATERLERSSIVLIGVVACPQSELRVRLVELPDRAAGGSRDLHGPADDGLEHGLQIECR